MEARDLLLEIGTEEIPARMIGAGVADLARLLDEALREAGLPATSIRTFATPRRMAVRASGIPTAQADREEWVYGPPVMAAVGPDGRPTKAAEGFARSQGVSPESLVRVPGPRGEVVAVRKTRVGIATMDWLARTLPGVLGRLSFPKSMRWGEGIGPFVRPVHWILARFGEEVVPFSFAGVTARGVTRGHRFLAPEEVPVPRPEDYEGLLRNRFVEPDPEERLRIIREAIATAEREHRGRFIAGDDLIGEVANLVEWPVFGLGGYDPAFLELPPEVLVTAMASHQRFFALAGEDGALRPRFGVVSNTPARDPAVVIRGNERVLAARLYDARFFYQQDLRHGIGEMARRLPERLFLKDAGDMAQKSVRVREIARRVWKALELPEVGLDILCQAADWCKADLMSAMVGEFPELQGTMGMYYARAAGADEPVAQAIREHYLPRHAGDVVPATLAGAVLAAADRLDTLATCFGVGVVPTGSKDPLGLRRAALGLIRISMEVADLARLPLGGWLDTVEGWDPEVRSRVEAFLSDRFRGHLTDEEGIPTDVAQAVGARLFSGAPPGTLVRRGRALVSFIRENRGFGEFLDQVFKRVGNLLRKADEDWSGWRERALREGLLEEGRDHRVPTDTPQETDVESLRLEVQTRLGARTEEQDVEEVLRALFSFRDPLARFFGTGKDGVPVLIEADEGLRLRRLALLARVAALFDGYADFGRISTR
ncbi:MAG TPA: glycine--tRNA ligase subunit beta [Myxococcota bacterium]|nr:glycine--tRNA ligase subunit beta [Myxococcota bacterium]HQK50271.1 glycine--tRNA ligase subunit beta [Myxococcota bacterium]